MIVTIMRTVVLILVVVVAKAMVCAGEVFDSLVEVVVIGMWVDVLINVLDAVAISLRFAVPVSHTVVYVMSGVEVDSLVDEFAGVLAGIILGVLSGTGIGALVDMNVNVFAGVVTVRFVMSPPLERFSC